MSAIVPQTGLGWRPQPRVNLPNQWASAERSLAGLHVFQSGEPLQAADLNGNFLYLLSVVASATIAQVSLAELAATRAGLEEATQRIAALEQAPPPPPAASPASIGDMQARLYGLARLVDEMRRRLEARDADQYGIDRAFQGRLEALEGQPAPATQTQLDAVAAPLAASESRVASMHRDVMRLREEVYRLARRIGVLEKQG